MGQHEFMRNAKILIVQRDFESFRLFYKALSVYEALIKH